MVEKSVEDADAERETGPHLRRRGLLNAALTSGLGVGGLAASVGSATGRSGGDTTASEFGGTVRASAVPIECDRTVEGELTPDDDSGFRGEGHFEDRYEFTVPTDVVGSIRLVRTPADSEGDPYLYLLDESGAIVAEDDDSAGNLDSLISAVSLDAGTTYTVLVTSFAPGDTFAYELSIGCADLTPERSLDCGETVSEALSGDDDTGFRGLEFSHDVFGFQGTEGEIASVRMTTSTPDDPTSGDPYLYLLDPDGTIVAQDDDSGGGSTALVTEAISRTGDYTVVATSASPNQEFEYDLTVDCRPFPEPGTIECDETVSDRLTSDDAVGFRGPGFFYDAYVFDGRRNQEVEITLTDTADEGDPYLYLLDPSGNIIAEDDDGGGNLNSRIVQLLTERGEYTVVATSFAPGQSFDYDLGLSCNRRRRSERPRCDQRIECGETLTGELTEDDRTGFRGPGYFQDVYCFTARRGDDLTLSLSSEAFGDPYLYLLRPNGDLVAEDDDGGGDLDSRIDLAVEQPGRHLVVATSYAPGDTFEYSLTLQCL